MQGTCIKITANQLFQEKYTKRVFAF